MLLEEWIGGEKDGIYTGNNVLAEKLFLGRRQSDKFLDSGLTEVIFMLFEVRKEREGKKNTLEGGRGSNGCR